MLLDRRLWRLIGVVRGTVLAAVAVGVLGALFGLAELALISVIIVAMVEGQASSTIAMAVVGAIICLGFATTCDHAASRFGHRSSLRIQAILREQLDRHVLALGPRGLAARRTGDVTVTIVEGVAQLQTFFGEYLVKVTVAAVVPVSIALVCLWLDPPTALVYLVAAIIGLAVPIALSPIARRAAADRHEQYTTFGSVFLDSLQGLATLQAFDASRDRAASLERLAGRVREATMAVLATNAAVSVGSIAAVSLGFVVALSWGAVRVSDGSLSLAVLVFVLMLGGQAFKPIRDLASAYHSGMHGASAAAGIVELLDEAPRILEPAVPEEPSTDRPDLQFDRVTYCYPGASDAALRDVSLQMRPGERVGIVGHSGSGKSTLGALLLRMDDVTSGAIRLAKVDIRHMATARLHGLVAWVAQDSYLFNGTIEDNLRLARPDASMADLEEAARVADALAFIRSLPDGFGTPIGERGLRLSGGQRQRLALARAILRRPAILVLDEATSSVDAASEARILAALDQALPDALILVMAHRLSSVSGAHRIVVLESGRLVEEGTHRDLITAGGAYARLMLEQTVDAGFADLGRADLDLPDALDGPAGETRRAPTGQLIDVAASRPVDAIPFLLRGLRELGGRVAGAVALSLAGWTAGIVAAILAVVVVQQVIDGGDPVPAAIALFIATLVSVGVSYLDGWLSHALAFSLVADLRLRLFRRIDSLGPGFLQRHRIGELTGIATHDLDLLEWFYAHALPMGLMSIVSPLVATIALGSIEPSLALVILPFVAIVAIQPVVSLGRQADYARVARHEGQLNSTILETVQGIREITALDAGSARLTLTSEVMTSYTAELDRFLAKYERRESVVGVLLGLGGLAILGAAAHLVATGSMERSQLPLALILAFAALTPITSLSVLTSITLSSFASALRVRAIAEAAPEVIDGPGVAAAGPVTDRIVLDAVSFQYDQSTRPALEDVDLVLPAGSTTALVGPSGAGKTTLGHLMLRFWDPSSGSILVDGADIKQGLLVDHRARIALVAQDTYLFHGSIRENLLIGKPDATEEELAMTVERAGLEDLIAGSAEGLDAPVGERGLRLSGGQRQRIAIARAFLKDAPILFLDEATSHLDAPNEARVRQSLERLGVGRTMIVSAHRLSTIKDADTIVVIEHGRVVEQGTHDALLDADGLYARLVRTQLRLAAGV